MDDNEIRRSLSDEAAPEPRTEAGSKAPKRSKGPKRGKAGLDPHARNLSHLATARDSASEPPHSFSVSMILSVVCASVSNCSSVSARKSIGEASILARYGGARHGKGGGLRAAQLRAARLATLVA